MSFRLVDTGWDVELDKALRDDHSSVRIICPFIKRRAAERLLERGVPDTFQVITRFNLGQMSERVTDTSALRLLLDNGAQVRGIKRLHTKLYLLGSARVIVTSANLTEAALLRNHEFGFIAEDLGIVSECGSYFERLWELSAPDLSYERLTDWERQIDEYLAGGAPPATAGSLGDEGVDVGVDPDAAHEPRPLPPWVDEATQAFVKFFGKGDNRAPRSMAVLDEVDRAGCHWACTYPAGKRPRQVQDDAVMFMARLVRDPNDILIFGRGVGMRHEPGSDDASEADIAKRSWKVDWPHYIRVHHAEFLAGSLGNGISLAELMDTLGADAFASTQRNARARDGNTNPRRAYMRQAAVELSAQGLAWLNDRLERAFEAHGQLPPETLDQLDWPPGMARPASPVTVPLAD